MNCFETSLVTSRTSDDVLYSHVLRYARFQCTVSHKMLYTKRLVEDAIILRVSFAIFLDRIVP
jgi:hypothetical protein